MKCPFGIEKNPGLCVMLVSERVLSLSYPKFKKKKRQPEHLRTDWKSPNNSSPQSENKGCEEDIWEICVGNIWSFRNVRVKSQPCI